MAEALLAMGFDPRALLHLRHLPRFARDLRRFRAAGGRVDGVMPILSDFTAHGGTALGHYFHQDLLVAQAIFEHAPDRHVDVGSRVDGFVAHVASFRTIDVLDIRPMPASDHPNIRFVQADITRLPPELRGEWPSVSCLHAAEHFGLGRYTDPIDPEGHWRGIDGLAALVRPGGRLYIGLPVGRPRVLFNAHRILDPRAVPEHLGDSFELLAFHWIRDDGTLTRDARPEEAREGRYGCGVYVLRRR